LPPEPEDICEKTFQQEKKRCLGSGPFSRAGCLMNAYIKLWICNGGKGPKVGPGDDFGDTGDGMSGLF
jgi:hypothetical protein